MTIWNGTVNNDINGGSSSADLLSGLQGNDSISGGAGNDTLDGGDGNDTLIGGTGADLLLGGLGNDVLNSRGDGTINSIDTLRGGLGDDSYYIDNAADLIFEDSGTGTGIDTVYTTVTLAALATNVENAVLEGTAALNLTGNGADNLLKGNTGANKLDGGLGNDSLDGNTGNDTLIGGDGNDTLEGGAGSDSMVGGEGSDVYVADVAGDVIVETGSVGIDTLRSLVTQNLSSTALLKVENLVLTSTSTTAINGTGNTLDNALTGNAANNVLSGLAGKDSLYGNQGNDSLDGGADADYLDGGIGNDTLNGGEGDDTYVVDVATDVIVENGTAGIDTLLSAVTQNLSNTNLLKVENLVLTSTSLTALNASGNTLANSITGNDANNVLTGLAGNDTLLGGKGNDSLDGGADNDLLDGGEGNDTMTGGEGSDTYVVDVAGDVIVETGAVGTDTVKSAISLNLTAANLLKVENVTLATGTAALNATGNDLKNTLRGNDGNNVLDGGTGDDVLFGGLGNDTFYVDSAGDQVWEFDGNGTADKIFASVSVDLDNILTDGIEQVELTGAANLSALGNALNNTLKGNDGNNVLDGKVGADKMMGGNGDDAYYVDNVNDIVWESVGTGADTVFASISYDLLDSAFGENRTGIDHITLLGTDSINATGNEFRNILRGNDGDNELDGGVGDDVMLGGLGSDTYYVDADGDQVWEFDGNGLEDLIVSTVSIDLADNVIVSGIESVNLIGDADLSVYGNDLANFLTGNGGDNLLDGWLGADTLYGGLGNDTYIVDNVGDVVYEFGGPSADFQDAIYASVSYSLDNFSTRGVENLLLTGSGDLDGTGNDLFNSLIGTDGNNRLDGKAGADLMAGGAGDDTYIVDNEDDVIYDLAASGNDYVESTVSYSLNNFLSGGVEDLALMGTANLDATGNGKANFLFGNDGMNRLDGLAGADSMAGGIGNDTYVVDDAGDVVYEFNSPDQGNNDTIESSVTFDLNRFVTGGVENLLLTGTDDISGYGNSLGNGITGNAGSNELAGGLGADTIYGGLGYDVLAGGDGNDVLVGAEDYDVLFGGNGNDLIDAGEDADDVYGDAGNDTLVGGTGDDILFGGDGDDLMLGNVGADQLEGGLGDDTLKGGNEGDTYYAYGEFGVDVISESDTAAVDLANGFNVDDLHFTSHSYNQLWFKKVGSDLEISVVNGADKVTVQGWYSTDSNHQVELIHEDYGMHVLKAANVDILVNAMAGFLPQDLAAPGAPSALVNARNSAWQMA